MCELNPTQMQDVNVDTCPLKRFAAIVNCIRLLYAPWSIK